MVISSDLYLRPFDIYAVIPLEVLFPRVPDFASAAVAIVFPVCVHVGVPVYVTVGVPFFVPVISPVL